MGMGVQSFGVSVLDVEWMTYKQEEHCSMCVLFHQAVDSILDDKVLVGCSTWLKGGLFYCVALARHDAFLLWFTDDKWEKNVFCLFVI